MTMTDIIRRNNVKVMGKGSRPMLFAHGFGCDQNMWRYIIPAFENDYKVIAFDYVGSGRSDISAYSTERYAGLDGYAQDILDVIAALDLRDIIYVGHSVSSMIGMLAAIRNPSAFSQMVFIGPSARYINDGDYIGGFEKKDIDGLIDTMEHNFIGWSQQMAPAIMQNADRPELAQDLEDSFCATDPVIARHFAQATFYGDNRKDLSKLAIPSLILQCSEDIIAPLVVGQYLHRALPGSTLRVMEATGHCPHVSAPAETIMLIEQFLNAETA